MLEQELQVDLVVLAQPELLVVLVLVQQVLLGCAGVGSAESFTNTHLPFW